jgi:hypothetical protein
MRSFWSIYQTYFALHYPEGLRSHLLALRNAFGETDERSAVIGGEERVNSLSQAELIDLLGHVFGNSSA